MTQLTKLIILSLVALGLAKKRYDNYQVIRVPSAAGLDEKLEEQNLSVMGHVIDGVDVLVAPENLEWFQQNFESFKVLNPNIQDTLDEEEQQIAKVASVCSQRYCFA
jgi:hypothetical protein